MDWNERKFRVLEAIIDDFILTATPVGSRTIARKLNQAFSSATIRNEMSDLEELGYLDQPHASAGRIPSYKAYRIYVDHLMQQSSLGSDESQRLRQHFDQRMDEVGQVIKHAAQVLSNATNYTSLVLSPQIRRMRIRRVQLVPITEETALVVVVTDAGVIKDIVIRVPEGISSDHLHAISEMLTRQLSDHTLEEMRNDFASLSHELSLSRDSFMYLMDVLDQHSVARSSDLVVGGSANLLVYPEFADMDKARLLLSTLETREQLVELLGKSTQLELSITIGPENEIEGLRDSSLVTVAYHIGEEKLGTLGILGPTRMDYPRVLSILECVRQVLSEVLGTMGDSGIKYVQSPKPSKKDNKKGGGRS